MTKPTLPGAFANYPLILSCSLLLGWFCQLHAAVNPFAGRWALNAPERIGWLHVEEKDGKLTAELLWNRGSVLPIAEASLADGKLVLKRAAKEKDISFRGLTASVNGDDGLTFTVMEAAKGLPDGMTRTGSGKRLPGIPTRPDLSKVVFGQPIPLFGNADLSSWESVEKEARSGWSVKDGILSNRVIPEKGRRSANLRTKQVFEDFRLTTEVRTLKDSNSGIFLRGVYEIQIMDSYGMPLDSHHMGALYSRITPTVAAEKPIGEWQTLVITLVDHHVTVVLNGVTIIDNQPALGCTGGALSGDDFQPGPIMLQGDHSDIDYRNMVLTPVKK